MRGDEAQGLVREVAAADEPPVVLLGQHHADESQHGGAVGEDADDVGAPADLEVETLLRIVRADLPPVRLREGGEGQDLLRGVGEQMSGVVASLSGIPR